MENRKRHIDTIQEKLSYLQTRVKNAGSLNLTDINLHAENFYRDFLNKFLGYSLKNKNSDKQNTAFIDLIDVKNKTAIQVTAQNDSKKITKTIKGFYSDPEYKDYKLKFLLISKEAKDYRTDFTNNDEYPFDHEDDIIDIPKLINIIESKETFELANIASFLNNEISFPRQKKEVNEVATIMCLLEYLSDDENYKEFDGEYECDPYEKINNRFKEYADYFIKDFNELLPIYGNTISEAKKHYSLDGVRAIKISAFLNHISNNELTKANNDPIIALNNLINYFVKKVTGHGISTDAVAIKYYLLDELIGCNIFALRTK